MSTVKEFARAFERSDLYAQLARGFWRPQHSLQREYDRLFAHRSQILCPIYEAEYDRDRALTPGATLADIAGFYRAFGLERATHERPDHLALELEFMRVLTYKEALALEAGRSEEAELCRDAQKKFLEAHLGRWVGIFAETLLQQTQSNFYRELAVKLRDFITVECQALGAQPQRITAHEAEPEIQMDCPLAHRAFA
ncbi:MAG: molecular chaperone TorD family protein [Candidatus Bipolaricaulota bacterium]|nr:molecular chaperone TorD family protein [Candidatus Bipolaricaulota bacterium]MDW8140685.1 molecular chaperone TorD family protein [Candidatus Bipolaricaulota bacterium]